MFIFHKKKCCNCDSFLTDRGVITFFSLFFFNSRSLTIFFRDEKMPVFAIYENKVYFGIVFFSKSQAAVFL